jgi:glucuronate isomerase
MRSNGVPEARHHRPRCLTTSTFLAWARTVPRLIGNPLYHWTHLELQRYFGIHEPLSEKTAPPSGKPATPNWCAPSLARAALLTRMKVRAVGTTDDPADSCWSTTLPTPVRANR